MKTTHRCGAQRRTPESSTYLVDAGFRVRGPQPAPRNDAIMQETPSRMLLSPAPPACPEPVVTLTGVAKRFASGTLALDKFDLVVRGGEFLTLLGPSGCGKSTVLRLIAGLAAPSAGSITWSGAKHRSAGRDVGFVFQEPTLMPWASALR